MTEADGAGAAAGTAQPTGQALNPEQEALLASNPFPGLRSYERNEADLFFGRQDQIDSLVQRLAQTRLVAVSGASGCGKSSLVKAGLLNELARRHEEDDDTRWLALVMRPENKPIANLAAALATTLPDPRAARDRSGPEDDAATDPSASRAGEIFGQLHLGELGLVDVVRLARVPPSTRVLVVVDQFEELFRSRGQARSDEASAFVALLLRAAAEPAPRISVVLTLRSDTLGGCADFAGLPEAVSAGSYLVPRLTRSQRQDAIVQPIVRRGARIAPRLVQHLLNDVSADFDDLPIMQHALSRTWRQWALADDRHGADGDRDIDLDDYRAIGEATSALTRHAEEARTSLGALGEAGGAVERVFRALTERTAAGTDVRRSVELGRLCAICGDGSAQGRTDVLAVVDRYRRADTAFLLPGPPVPLADDQVIDISHESLIRQWEALRGWALDEAAARSTLDRLVAKARDEENDQAEFLSGRDLENAEDWLQRNHPSPAWVQLCRGGPDAAAEADHRQVMAFLDGSRRAQQRAQRKTRLLVLGVRSLAVAVTLSSLAALGVGWFMQQKALAREWAGQAIVQGTQDPARSARLALDALDKDDTHDRAEFALRRAMASLEIARTEQMLVFPAPINAIADTADGRVLAVASGSAVWLIEDASLAGDGEAIAGGRVQQVDRLASGQHQLTAPAEVLEVHPLADGRAVVATATGEVHVLPGAQSAQPAPPSLTCGTNPQAVWSVHLQVRDAGSAGEPPRAVVACSDGTVEVWDLPRNQAPENVVNLRPGEGRQITALAISDNGGFVAMGTNAGDVALWDASRPGPGLRTVPLPKGTTADPAAKPGRRKPEDVVVGEPRHVEALRFRPGPNTQAELVAADNAGNVWNLQMAPQGAAGRPNAVQAQPMQHRYPVTRALHFTRDNGAGSLLATVSKRTVTLWGPGALKQLELGHDAKVTHVDVSADGELLATIGADGQARVLTTRSPAPVAALRGHASTVTGALFRRGPGPGESQRLVTTSLDGTLRVWRIRAPDLLVSRAMPLNTVAFAGTADGQELRLLLCGDFLLVPPRPCMARPLALTAGEVANGNRDGMPPVASVGGPSDANRILSPVRASVSSDGQLALFAIDYDGVFGGRTPFLIRTLDANGEAQPIYWAALDSARQAVFGPGKRGEIAVLGKDDDTVSIYGPEALPSTRPDAAPEDLPKPRALIPPTPGRVREDIALSPDGQWVATAEGISVVLWRRGTDGAIAGAGIELQGHNGQATAMAFSPDSTRFVVASTDRTARVWKLATLANDPGLLPVELEGGHSTGLTSASFSADGKWVVTSGNEGTIRVWSADTGNEMAALLSRHRGKVNQVLFDPRGGRIVSVGDDGVALVSACESCVMPLKELRALARKTLALNDADRKWLERMTRPD